MRTNSENPSIDFMPSFLPILTQMSLALELDSTSTISSIWSGPKKTLCIISVVLCSIASTSAEWGGKCRAPPRFVLYKRAAHSERRSVFFLDSKLNLDFCRLFEFEGIVAQFCVELFQAFWFQWTFLCSFYTYNLKYYSITLRFYRAFLFELRIQSIKCRRFLL